MNSRVFVLLLIVVVAAVLFQKSDAFTAGAGNIMKKRDVTEAARRLMHVCEAARKSCFMLDMKKTVNKMTIDELDDEERQQGEE